MTDSQVLLPLYDGQFRVDGYFYDPKSTVIYHAKSIHGKKVKFSTGVKVPNILKAKREGNRILQERLGAKRKFVTPLIKDELANWLKLKESEGLKKNTMPGIYQAEKRIRGFWESMFPYEITRDKLAEWYAWLEVEYPGQQKEKAIKWMRNFARYLAEKQHNGRPLLPALPKIADPDFKKVRAARKKKKERIFTVGEFKKIYEAGNETEKLIAIFMYTMASRIDETLNLKWNQEIIEGSWIYRWSVGQNKADHTGQHKLHPKVVELLERSVIRKGLLFHQKNNKTKPLRPQMINWADWRRRADLGWHWTSHTFRHTCLSNLFNDEKNPQALICKLYRVSLAVAMETYVKPTTAGIEKMRTAIEVSL